MLYVLSPVVPYFHHFDKDQVLFLISSSVCVSPDSEEYEESYLRGYIRFMVKKTASQVGLMFPGAIIHPSSMGVAVMIEKCKAEGMYHRYTDDLLSDDVKIRTARCEVLTHELCVYQKLVMGNLNVNVNTQEYHEIVDKMLDSCLKYSDKSLWLFFAGLLSGM